MIRPGAVPSKIQSLHAQIKMRVAGVSACSSLRKGPYGLAESTSDFPQPDSAIARLAKSDNFSTGSSLNFADHHSVCAVQQTVRLKCLWPSLWWTGLFSTSFTAHCTTGFGNS